MILILSNKFDISVDYVVRVLRERKEKFLRINTEDLVERHVSVKFPRFSYDIQSKTGKHDLVKELKSVLFRRPGRPFEFTPRESRPSDTVVKFVEDQWHSFIEGLRCIENVLWVNDPIKNHDAENKIKQLELAEKLHFMIPRTCITSSKEEVLDFYNLCQGNIVAKGLYSPLIEYPDKDYFVFTTVIESIDDIGEEELSLAPTIFQELLSEKIDYRVTVIGEHCFTVRIESSADKVVPIDWRTAQEDLQFVPCKLPLKVTRKCIELVKRLGLVFGALDLVKVNEKFYFLEINPNGEWGWLQKQVNLPIAETLVEYLVRGTG